MYRSDNATQYGFRIVGSCRNDRRLIDWPLAFLAHSQCDEKAEVNRESYLSAFTFGSDFANHLATTGSTKGYAGPCGALWLWFDIDRADDIDAATTDARTLAAGLSHGYGIEPDSLLCFFSGSKGYHIGFPMAAVGSPKPSEMLHKTCRQFAESIATKLGVTIDTGVYDRVRAFRAPNSRHPKTGRYKRFLTFDALHTLQSSRLVEMASGPEPFEIPDPPPSSDSATADWASAVTMAKTRSASLTRRRDKEAPATLNRATMEFIRDGATTGDRHRRLFSAAANLAEFGCSTKLADALLREAALDSGLTPSEVRRQIECGLKHWGAAT